MKELLCYMNDITADQALEALTSAGYLVKAITKINEGSNHYIFQVLLSNGKLAICKFARTRATEAGIVPPHTDTLFGGRLSLAREASLFSMIREKSGVPTPRVFGMHTSPFGDFLFIESLPGKSFKQYLRDSGYSARAFTSSLRMLGRDFADIQKIRFLSFGNVMENDIIEPSGLTNFANRWTAVLDMLIACCVRKGAFSTEEVIRVRKDFFDRLEDMRPYLDVSVSPSVLNLTDMHAENFFVDATGKPSGYFDLESAQAAPAALEFYGFRFFLFNFYDKEWFERAESCFFEGYLENGGEYAPLDVFHDELVEYLSACRLLELTNSYWGHIDGVRDQWGQEMKGLLFHYLETGIIDYPAIGNIWRQRDGQPSQPLLP